MPPVDPALLEGLVPLRNLEAEALARAATAARMEHHPARSLIFRSRDPQPSMRYVVSGTVILVQDKDRRRAVTGTGNADIAPEPLSGSATAEHDALAATDVTLISLPRELVEELLAGQQPPDYTVDEISADTGDAGEAIFYRLFEDLVSDRLELPSMPDIAVRVRDAVNRSEAGPAELARILQADPAISARLIQLANGALYGGRHQVDALQPAIVRLGSAVTREVVTAMALQAVFRSDNAELNRRMRALWTHSVLVACTAQALARRVVAGFDPERAVLAGLTHDIGTIPLITGAQHYPELVGQPHRLDATIRHYRAQTGTMILRHWHFPENIVGVPLAVEDWQRDNGSDNPDYADLVTIARLLCPPEDDGQADAWPGPEDTAAWQRLQQHNPELPACEELPAIIREDIEEGRRLLAG